ncbi:MAG: UDP-glucose--hexose-1-phosphate uridylyltransferase [Lachnospiraceae bacterium]|nr:UDP-glucose--hexose-1-phosphate uridylyltransferase [Lachnospiraceae bacterium]
MDKTTDNAVDTRITQLVKYGMSRGLVPEEERIYTVNALLEILKKDGFRWDESADCSDTPLCEILDDLLDYAYEKGLIQENTVTYRDLFDTKLMAALTPRPKAVIDRFRSEYEKSPEAATDFFYSLSKDSNYIRTDRIERDIRFKHPSPYGELDITINMSKPEKDPKAVAAAGNMVASYYPRCLICVENEGYAGRIDHPARGNHRIIPIRLCGDEFGLQYSPYVYYNEHCIVINREHVPMKIDGQTIARLLDFVAQFPHYIMGSNADLPIVGGSILSHDHFQGGRYVFPMAKADPEKSFKVRGFEDIEACIVRWPMSVIRIAGPDKDRLTALACHILERWQGYSDESASIFAETDGEVHNTITPIARKKGDVFELDLVLRNNLTTPDRPLGIFNSQPKYHHIKKENIGLIEVMGLAILPSRLKAETAHLAELIEEALESGGAEALEKLDVRAYEDIKKHADWFEELRARGAFEKGNAERVLRFDMGEVFTHVLEDCGVYKTDEAGREAFMRFVEALNDQVGQV